jgi:SAM-dependent methyltransferase
MTTMNAEAWDARYRKARDSAGARLWSAVPTALLPQSVAGWRPGRALDLATGDGRNAIWLAANGWRVTAVDFSTEAIKSAKGHALDVGMTVDWQCADVTTWLGARAQSRNNTDTTDQSTNPDSNHLFDLITIIYLHIPHPELVGVIESAHKLLAPGGHLLAIGHDVENIGSGTSGPTSPAILYTPELLASAVSAGSIERCETVSRDVAADPELSSEITGTARDTILIARAEDWH